MTWRVEVVVTIHERRASFTLDVALSGDEAPLALIGPNGSGKSTLLRAIVGGHRSAQGRIVIDGHVLLDSSAGIRERVEARRVGYIPQGLGLFSHRTALGNVAFGLEMGSDRERAVSGASGASAEERRAEARALLAELGCGELADRAVENLSGGERQKVALARALAVRPRLLLLDEPLASLDVVARRDTRRFLVERLRALGQPSILVTHDVRDVIALDARVCVLEDGRVVQWGTVDELREAPANAFVAAFLGDAAASSG